MKRVAAWLFLAFSLAFAQVEIPFWHAMDGPAGRAIDQFAKEFNAKQRSFRVVPVYKGDYRDEESSLVSALRAGGAPVLYQAEVVFFPRLVAEGSVVALDDLVRALPFENDLFDEAWEYGITTKVGS